MCEYSVYVLKSCKYRSMMKGDYIEGRKNRKSSGTEVEGCRKR